MRYIIIFSVIAHLWVVLRAVKFFRHRGAIRERDKSIVATLAALSVFYVVMMLGSWPEMPWTVLANTLGTSTLAGFVFANSVFYLGLIKGLTKRRQWHLAEGRLARSRRS